MKNVRTWISRVSAIALVAVSVSASADIDAPDFLVHKASVSLKTSQQSLDGIETDTIKTKNVINYLMRRYADLDGKNEKDENLGLVTGCDTFGLDTEAFALAVYDKKLKVIKPFSDVIVFDIAEGNVEFNNIKNQLKKSNIIAFLEGILDVGVGGVLDPIDVDVEFMSLTADVKYGKIGNKVVKDGLPTWDKDTICASNFKTKSLTGAGGELGLEFFLRDTIVMSGKINAGGAQFGFNDPNFIPFGAMRITKINDLDGFFDPFDPDFDGWHDGVGGTWPAEIGYTVTVQNIGQVPLTGVTVEDVGLGEVVCGNDLGGGVGDFPGTLAVGEDVVCVGDKVITELEYLAICSIVDPIGPGAQVNVAAANSNESNLVATSNTVLFRCIDPNEPVADLSIIKTPDLDVVGIGDTIDYEILVTNTGLVTLTDVVVLDLFEGTADVNCAVNTLDPGDFVVCTTNLLVTPEIGDDICLAGGIVRNVAVVTALDPGLADIGPFGAEANVELDNCVNIGPVF